MIFFRKYFFKIVVSVFIIAFLVIAPYPLFNKINELNYNFNSSYKLNFSGVLELWNVDTFEGGSVSRTLFLEKRAIEFEKKNKGAFILVKNITLEQLENNIKNNKRPNIITFGVGAGELIENEIITLDNSYNVRSDLLVSSSVNNKLKALPIMLGGYCLITNKDKLNTEDINEIIKNNLVYSNNEYNLPLMSLLVNNLKYLEKEEFSLDSFSAYDKFINDKYFSLLGSQRDYYRCLNRENNGKIACNYKFLKGYTDLIVYSAIFASDSKTENVCKSFLEYLVSDYSQNLLNNIGMFSVLNKKIYSEEGYKAYNEMMLQNLKTINVFYSNATIKNIQNLLNEYFMGKSDNKKEILNYLNG